MLNDRQIAWCEEHHDETLNLLRTLGKIPAPSHYEHKRCSFIMDLLKHWGADEVYTDEALNVIWPVNLSEGNDLVVIMAHTDIVFPDTEPLEMHEEDGKLYAPGIGDDTANLVNLLMCAKYVLENKPSSNCGILFVANSCEEGLGNLKGSKQILKDFGNRIKEFISLDGYMNSITDVAVGSHRYRITVTAQGGHSFSAFGNTNAIVQMAEIVTSLYQKQPPTKARTTYNAGIIEGGTTVNSICAECSLMYEYRSEDRECLKEMEDYFNSVILEFRNKGFNINVELLGARPCKGDVDEHLQNRLTEKCSAVIERYTGQIPPHEPMSTDANTFLSAGIPSVVFGAVNGAGAHTRGEWIELSSMLTGQKIALETILTYFDN